MRLGQLVSEVKRLRNKGIRMGKVNRSNKRIARVMSNVHRPWYSGEMNERGMTPNLWR